MTLPSSKLLKTLQARYQEPHRAYHNWTHIEALLTHFQTLKSGFVNEECVLWALYWHDAVYDPRRSDNEVKSAELFQQDASGQLALEFVKDVVTIIESTIDHRVPDEANASLRSDIALFLDLDLSILGAPKEKFDLYEDQIRQEFAHVPDDAYRVGRRQVLSGFAKRKHVFMTDVGRFHWESPARDNLARSLRHFRD